MVITATSANWVIEVELKWYDAIIFKDYSKNNHRLAFSTKVISFLAIEFISIVIKVLEEISGTFHSSFIIVKSNVVVVNIAEIAVIWFVPVWTL